MRMMKCQRCGEKVEWKSRRKYCLKCADIVNREMHKEYIKKNGRTPKKHTVRKVKCKCPRCEKIHIVAMQWTGNGMPRVYCYNCSYLIDNTYVPEAIAGNEMCY